MMNATATVYIRKLFGPLVVALSLFCLALVASPTTAVSQEIDECAGGTLFYIAFPDSIGNTYDTRFPHLLLGSKTYTLMVYSPITQEVEAGRGKNPGGRKYTIPAGKFIEINTEEVVLPLITSINTPQSNVLRLQSEYPVIVYCYFGTAFGAEAYTAIPVESWGQEYFAATWPGEIVRDVFPSGEFNYRTEPKEGQSEILVIAAYDNTNVTIQSTAPLRSCAGCQTVKLQAGEAYQVQSIVDLNPTAGDQDDLAGTRVFANKRIAVISGNPRLMHNSGVRPSLGENAFKNSAIEWLPPVEQHGTEFVFLPTWDDRRQREGLDLEESRDAELVRIFGTTNGNTEVSWTNALGTSVPATKTPIKQREFTHEKIGVAQPRVYHTSQPSMGMQSPHAVVKFNGTTTWGANYVGASYGAWSTYMVEMVAREQWVSEAPIRAPNWPPTGMTNYLNICTDSSSANAGLVTIRQEGTNVAQQVNFNLGKVPGSDLVWTSINLAPGSAYFIEGKEIPGGNGERAKFYGFVYGSWKGNEQYRPGGTKKKDDDGKGTGVAGGGETGDDPEVLHPSEYEEDIALMYGYPFAPSRCVLADPDEYKIETDMDCEVLTINIEALNDPASGIRSITLLPDSSDNAQLVFVDPSDPIDFKATKVTEAELQVIPINPRRNAHGVIIIRDRTRNSQRWRVEYNYIAEDVQLTPEDELDFGKVTINQTSPEKSVTITNPLGRDLVLKRLSFVFGNQDFVITRTDPEFDWESDQDSIILAPGESVEVFINITPKDENRTYVDSLKVELGCLEVTLPIRAGTATPCVRVEDLNFGELGVGVEKKLPLTICNRGEGSVTFNNPWLTWLATEFTVDPAEIAKLQAAVLGPDECVTITVGFSANQTGLYRTTSRFWASTRDCRDTSNWVAKVVKPGPQITGYDWKERWLSADNECTKNETVDYPYTLKVSNSDESEDDFRINDVYLLDSPDKSPFRLDGDVVTSLRGKTVRPSDVLDLPVWFKPMSEGVYGALVVLQYEVPSTGQKDSIVSLLEGVGIESYIKVNDQVWTTPVRFQTPGAQVVTRQVTVSAPAEATREVTLYGVDINPATHFRLNPTWVASNGWNDPNDDRTIGANNIVLQPGDAITVDVDFIPQDADPDALTKNATIDVYGDFADADCAELSDSSGTLTGTVYTLGASVEGFDFGTLLTCFEGDGFITVSNLGTDPINITSITQPSPSNIGLSVDETNITYPLELAPQGDPSGGDVVQIPVHFAPKASGSVSATVTIEFFSIDGETQLPSQQAILIGNSETITVNMSIDDTYRQFPGLGLQIPVMLDDDPSQAQVTEFIINLNYNDGMMLIRKDGIKLGGLVSPDDGWEMEVVSRDGESFTVRIFNTAGRFLSGTGEVLVLDFVTFIGDVTESDLPFNVTPVKFGQNLTPCIDFTTTPGHAELDEVCGLNFRLIEAIGASKYAPPVASPSIVQTTTAVEFGVGLDADTKIEVFNQNGDKVGVLVNQFLDPGTYTVTWDARSVPSGKYFLRMTSGHWTRTSEVIVRK